MKKLKNFIVRDGVELEKNKDVFLIDGKWVKKELTAIDNYTGKRVVTKNANLVRVYNKINSTNKVYTSKPININGSIFCASILEEHKDICKHLYSDDVYCLNKHVIPINNNPNRHTNYSYVSKPINNVVLPSKNIYPSLFSKYTYGIEIETSNGDLSDEQLSKYGFTTLYDGSISGHEVVSMPLRADNLFILKEFFHRLGKCTNIDSTCSLHIHIGNIKRTEANLCRLYDIFYKLQDELWNLIPYYKRDMNYLKKLSKDYVKNLIKLDVNIENILGFFGLAGYSFSDVKSLSRFFNNTKKWNIDGRYHAINFINYICNPAGTIELRLLQSTFCWTLIQTWLFVNTMIIDYALNNFIIDSKNKISIEDIVNSYTGISSEFRSKLLTNINTIKSFYFNAIMSRTNLHNDLNRIDRELDEILIKYD